MARHLLIAGLIVGVVLTLSGCGFIARHAGIGYGNYEFSQGRYDQAVEQYERVLEYRDDPDTARLVQYNIGNTLYASGDVRAAVERWQSSLGSDDRTLEFRSSFNLAVSLYEQGDYRQAYDQFRAALRIDPSNEPAKQNLELAFSRWQSAGAAAPSGSTAEQPEDAELDEAAREALELLRTQNAERFRARDERQVPEDVDDW